MSQADLKQKTPKNKQRVEFKLDRDSGSQVYVAGSFNDWKPEEMKYDEKKGLFTKVKMLAPGQYEYKFVVNGEWVVDAENEDFVYNDQGSMNSLKVIE